MTSFRNGCERARTPSTRGSHTTTVHCQSSVNREDGLAGTHRTRLTMSKNERNTPRQPPGASTDGEAGVEWPRDAGDELRLIGHQEGHRVCDVLRHQDLNR